RRRHTRADRLVAAGVPADDHGHALHRPGRRSGRPDGGVPREARTGQLARTDARHLPRRRSAEARGRGAPVHRGVPGHVELGLADTETRAAVESAQAKTPSQASFPGIRSTAATKAEVLIVPRVHGEYAEFGTVATVERIGRVPGGKAAVLLRGTARALVGRI